MSKALVRVGGARLRLKPQYQTRLSFSATAPHEGDAGYVSVSFNVDEKGARCEMQLTADEAFAFAETLVDMSKYAYKIESVCVPPKKKGRRK